MYGSQSCTAWKETFNLIHPFAYIPPNLSHLCTCLCALCAIIIPISTTLSDSLFHLCSILCVKKKVADVPIMSFPSHLKRMPSSFRLPFTELETVAIRPIYAPHNFINLHQVTLQSPTLTEYPASSYKSNLLSPCSEVKNWRRAQFETSTVHFAPQMRLGLLSSTSTFFFAQEFSNLQFLVPQCPQFILLPFQFNDILPITG